MQVSVDEKERTERLKKITSRRMKTDREENRNRLSGRHNPSRRNNLSRKLSRKKREQ